MKKELLLLFCLVGCVDPYQDLHKSLDETLEIIDKLYPEKPNIEKMRQGMLNGLIQGTDTHGSYLDEMSLKNLVESVDGGDLKLGMVISKHKNGLFVKKVYENSPAYIAGLVDGDILTNFDGYPLKDITLDSFLKLIKEKKSYLITLIRDKTTLEKKVTPGTFIAPSTELKWLDSIAYLKFGCINKNAADEVAKHLQTIKKNKKSKGLILDLRDCPGGSFEAGVGIASQFLDGHVVVEMHKKEDNSKFSSAGFDTINKLSVIILQNKNTCSAGEIISAALKAHKRATLMGENTAGSATAKSVIHYPNRKDGLILTIAFLNDPNGKRIGKEGLEPDITLKDNEVSKIKKMDFYISEALKFLNKKQ